MFLLLIITLVFLLIETIMTSLPLFLIIISIFLILYSTKHSTKQNELVFVLAFLGGLILDASTVRQLGGSSLFLTGWLFIILLYERKYKINTIPFVLASSFLGVFLYLWLFGYGEILKQSAASSIIAVLLFKILSVRSAPQNFQLSSYKLQ